VAVAAASTISAAIWWHETLVLPRLLDGLETVLLNRPDLERLRMYLEGRSRRSKALYIVAKIFVALWILFVLWMVGTSRFIGDFGIEQWSGWWLPILLGAYMLGHHTGLLGLLGAREIVLFGWLGRHKISFHLDPYHEDGIGGFSFLTNFAVNISFMLASAILFVPLFTKWSSEEFLKGDYRPLIALITYFILIAGAFLYPLLKIRRKIIYEKKLATDRIRPQLRSIIINSDGHPEFRESLRLLMIRDRLIDMQRIRAWPFRLEFGNLLKIVVPLTSLGYIIFKVSEALYFPYQGSFDLMRYLSLPDFSIK